MHESTTTQREAGPAREAAREADESARRDCPECGGRVVRDDEHGESACRDCGLVLEERALDRGPEWRSFEDGRERGRVGAPSTLLLHDKGLSTTIGWKDRDAYGNRLGARKRTRLSRLRTWDRRFRTKDAHERNLKHALGEIRRMASALGLPDSCTETAGVLYRRALERDLLPGRSIESVSTACLYAAARQHGTPRTLGAFERVSRVERLPIQRAYRYLCRELGLEIAPADPLQYVHRYASALDASDETERVAADLLQSAKREGAHSGKSPSGLAASALYAAGRLTDESLTQGRVSEAADVSEVTIRNRYRELLDAGDSGVE